MKDKVSEAFGQDSIGWLPCCLCSSACSFVMICVLWICWLPLQVRVKGRACEGLLKLVPHWLMITSKKVVYEPRRSLYSLPISFELDIKFPHGIKVGSFHPKFYNKNKIKPTSHDDRTRKGCTMIGLKNWPHVTDLNAAAREGGFRVVVPHYLGMEWEIT